MTNLFTDIPLEGKKDTFHAVIEIPRGSAIKYEYNEHMGCMMLDRLFKTPVTYPQNYGFFPRTWNKYDKDPMDVIIVCSQSINSGTVVPVRVVGIIEMDDTGELDHKILAVPAGDHRQENVMDIADFDHHTLENMTWFLNHYKDREAGKEVKILGVKGKGDALAFLAECKEEYEQNHA